MYRPTVLRQFLESLGQKPKRTMSQNFLVDWNIVAKIVAEVVGKTVVEIGPGPGVLTEAFLAAGLQVVAIEKDHAFATSLSRFNSPLLHCYEADVLTSPLEAWIPPGATIVSNLPYHLTTPIVERLLSLSHLFSKAILMVQEEFARRLLKGRCVTSLMAHLSCTVQYNFPVRNTCFWPRPKVNSAVITLTPRESIPIGTEDRTDFLTLLRTAFSHKRKALVTTVGVLYSRESVQQALISLALLSTARPEELSLDEWVGLFRALKLQQ